MNRGRQKRQTDRRTIVRPLSAKVERIRVADLFFVPATSTFSVTLLLLLHSLLTLNMVKLTIVIAGKLNGMVRTALVFDGSANDAICAANERIFCGRLEKSERMPLTHSFSCLSVLSSQHFGALFRRPLLRLSVVVAANRRPEFPVVVAVCRQRLRSAKRSTCTGTM